MGLNKGGQNKEASTDALMNGKADLVVPDAESYQQLLDAKGRVDAIEGIGRGLRSMKTNAGKPAADFFRGFFAEKRIPEE
jgi:hypothetical protein